ncbi:hypothetical protein FBQ97_00210, partial [Acidobacteria bacterium ACD]|nr:hypothetical protein [Acidobacteria bacterium ACD]
MRRSTALVAATLAGFLCAAGEVSATDVGGPITTNTTWTLAGSPYIVTSNVTVNAGVTLTVEPGVLVKFALNTALTVNGKLTAIGTSGSPITFTSNAASPA